MNRVSLNDDITRWKDMVRWMRENFGEEQKWRGKATEPTVLKKSYKWAIGEHRMNPADPNSFCWLCFWIPDGPVYTAFLLRWS